jgi:hypothetical protein
MGMKAQIIAMGTNIHGDSFSAVWPRIAWAISCPRIMASLSSFNCPSESEQRVHMPPKTKICPLGSINAFSSASETKNQSKMSV